MKLSTLWSKKQDITSEENPYLKARMHWNATLGGLMSSLQLWQCLALVSLAIALASIGGLIFIGSQSKFIPLVFQQDATGNILSMTRGDSVPPPESDDYKAAAAHFIEHIRLVTADNELQRRAILETYAYLSPNDAAAAKANDFLNGVPERNPFQRALKEVVTVEIRSVMPLSSQTWQVDWRESVRNLDGSVKEAPVMMRAIITMTHYNPNADTTNTELLKNPHFLFVRDFNWSKLI